MNKMEQLRAKLREMDNRTNGTSSGNSNDSIYPFWNIKTNDSAHVRFLPDANEDNVFFWSEKQMIKLTFPGVAGEDENKEVSVQVPCMEMWGETCPVHDEIRPWFKEPSLEETARKYWKKRTYIFQGFVVQDGVGEDEPPENPIRRFSITGGLFKIIKAALLDPDMEHLPTDYDNGTNFIITKTQNGKYADYGTSKWARKESALDPDQMQAVESDEYGLADLSTYLPKKPTPEALAAIYEMFEASVNGELYDPSRWAKYYRPYGLEWNEDASASKEPKASAKAAAEPSVADDDDVPPFETKQTAPATESAGGEQSADDIIAMIRNRKSS